VRRSIQSFGFLQAVLALVLCAVFSFAAQAGGKRVALVVGNGAYQSVPQLPNPKNDATLVAGALRKQGFEVVTAIDLTKQQLESAVEQYARSLNGAEISLFYYSGHGIEVGGENRIIPVDATLSAPEELETQTYSLQTIMLQMQSNSKAQLIYMDACRDNPFSDRKFLTGVDEAEKPAGKGLAEQKGAVGSLIAYATEPGKVALDGKGANSPFTEAVIKHSFSQGTDVQNALMKVTEEVWTATNQEQRPWVNSTLIKPVFLTGLFVQTTPVKVPPVVQTFSEIQQGTRGVEIVAAPLVYGAGPQLVFSGEQAKSVPAAEAYQLMEMPLSGTLSINGQTVAEGSQFGFANLQSLAFEPPADLNAPAALLQFAAVSAKTSPQAFAVRIPQIIDDCDVLAGEPLDLQGVGKGVELKLVDALLAKDACSRAVSTYPENPRFIYQFGRAQLAAGDVAEATRLFKLAADAGYVRAFCMQGVLAEKGIGREKDQEEANRLFKLAADKGDPYALQFYGRNLVKGVGIKADAKEGMELLKRAAELGNSDALDEMGALYLYGGNLKADPRRAVGFLEASAKRSVKKKRSVKTIETDIGTLYFKGEGVKKDYRQAAKWYELGAERGNQGGVGDLSWIYAQGPDDLRNPSRAVWYTALALATDGLAGDAELLRRLALLPDDAKRVAMRDFINLVGPCATQTTDDLDDTLMLLSRRTWLLRQIDEGELDVPGADGSFGSPDGTDMASELKFWNRVNEANTDQAYLAYLQNFPEGVFANIARGRLGGLLEHVKIEPAKEQCESPKPVKKVDPPKRKVEQPKRKIEPPPVRKPPPVIEKPKPKPVPPKVKPRPVKPKPQKPPRRPRPPREDPPEFDPEPEFEPEPDDPPPEIDVENIREQIRKLKLRRKRRVLCDGVECAQ
jgi:TPR repeat protein